MNHSGQRSDFSSGADIAATVVVTVGYNYNSLRFKVRATAKVRTRSSSSGRPFMVLLDIRGIVERWPRVGGTEESLNNDRGKSIRRGTLPSVTLRNLYFSKVEYRK